MGAHCLRFHVGNAQVVTRHYLFLLCASWTIAQMVFLTAEFLHDDSYTLPHMMPLYNLILLAIYVVTKEVARWAHKAIGRKHGEYFFVAWWLFALALFLASAVSRGQFVVPDGLFPNCWFVSAVYIASRFSKLLHQFRHHAHNHR